MVGRRKVISRPHSRHAVACCDQRRAWEQATARRSPGEPQRHRLPVSYACRAIDAVDAAALLLGRSNREPELLLQGAREDAAHGVALPSRDTPTSSTVAP